ncbi:glycoside hydrolase family 43 protein [Larkinella sp. VNQ87]|uniref:glycoside hydrolase family 43 protein n=1 Tax=Larkinella sp. VNQ87 TaxID=3400921 RepID=UPI003C0BE778
MLLLNKALFFVLVLTGVFTRSFSQQKATNTYRNPVIAGDFADPSVIRVGDTYYAVGTSSEWGPAYPIYTSPDLINWTYVGPVFQSLPTWTMGSYWAPELFHRNGTFYVYYTARRKADKRSYIGVASTRDLRKGFTDHGLLLEWTSEAIDAYVIEDQGKLFITWKAYGLDKGKDIELLGAELSPDGLKVTGKAFHLLTAERNTWEAGGAEGQAIFRRGRYFYMLYSGNACCGTGCNYQVGLARAETLQGPWEKFAGNPVLVGDEAWKCPGHGTVVTTPDNRYFYLHHAYNGTDFTFTGRQGVLSELVWDAKTAWPVFRYGNTTPAQAESPTKTAPLTSRDLVIDFEKPPVEMPWVWDVSQPKPSFTVEKGVLHLQNTATGPTGSFLGMVLKKGRYTFSARVLPKSDAMQSVTLYGDASHALGLGVGRETLELWQIKDGVRQVLKSQPLPATTGPVQLQIQSYGGPYFDFYWTIDNGKPERFTTSPVEGAFLPRWDRAPRIGLSVSGEGRGAVQAVALRYD